MKPSHTLQVVDVTMGDPIGIGPQIPVTVFRDDHHHTICRPVVIGDLHTIIGVNITLSLPIIQTSADHETAHDISRQGITDPSNLIEAVKIAAFQAENKIRG